MYNYVIHCCKETHTNFIKMLPIVQAQYFTKKAITFLCTKCNINHNKCGLVTAVMTMLSKYIWQNKQFPVQHSGQNAGLGSHTPKFRSPWSLLGDLALVTFFQHNLPHMATVRINWSYHRIFWQFLEYY